MADQTTSTNSSKYSTYQSPLAGRYASREMKKIFSADTKFSTWRTLWYQLAKAEQQLGLDITDEQLQELHDHIHDINYEVAEAREREVRHDVMAHVYAYGQQCPHAAGIIHLGATSCYVTDNADILIFSAALQQIKREVLEVIKQLAGFAKQYADLPTLGYTHGQPAAPTTVGKRATLWLQNFMENLDELDFVYNHMKLLGCRGATGSSDTFMELFHGDEEKVEDLDWLIAEGVGGGLSIYPVSGQTYPRNLDIRILNCLAAIAASAYKMANDIRILQHDKEIEEPFEKNQIGSSAMAYKRNPMRSERICSLARFVQSLTSNAYDTANVQWLERTLDDSANRRLSIPDAFLATDGMLTLCANVTKGLVVYPAMIRRHLEAELPFMATERIIMKAVEKGGDRQELHERIREYSMEATKAVKMCGEDNPLIDLIMGDAAFNTVLSPEDIQQILDPTLLIGRCEGQTRYYVSEYVGLVLEDNAELMAQQVDTEVKV